MTEFETGLASIEKSYDFIFAALNENLKRAKKDRLQKIVELMRTHNIKNIAVEQVRKGIQIKFCADRDGGWWFEVGSKLYDNYDDKEESEMMDAIEQAEELQLLVKTNWGAPCDEYGLNPDIEYW